MPGAIVVGQLTETEMDELRELREAVDAAQRVAAAAQTTLVQEQTLLQAFVIRLQRSRGLLDGDEVRADGRIVRAGQFPGADLPAPPFVDLVTGRVDSTRGRGDSQPERFSRRAGGSADDR